MSQMQPKRSPVALGGMLAALSVVFAFMSQFMPLFYCLVAPLPLAVGALLISMRYAVMMTVAASLLVGILLGPLAGVGFACQSALMGLVAGWLVKGKRSYGTLFTFVTIAQAVGMAAFVLTQFALMGFDVNAFSETYLNIEDEMLANAQSLGVFETVAQSSGISVAAAEASFVNTTHLLVQMMPGIYVVMFFVTTALFLMILHWVGVRMNIQPNVEPPQLKTIIMPTWTLVPFLGAWIVLLLDRYIDIHLLWIVAVNVMVIGAACMVIDGFSYTIAKLKFSEATLMWKMIYIFLALFIGVYIIIFFAAMGVFDCILDFRNLRTTQKGAKSV